MAGLTYGRIADVIGVFGDSLAGEDIEQAEKTSGEDPEEGPEWLPYYKAAISIVIGGFGEAGGLLFQLSDDGRIPAELRVTMREKAEQIARQFAAAAMLTRVGPSDDPEVQRRAEEFLLSELAAQLNRG